MSTKEKIEVNGWLFYLDGESLVREHSDGTKREKVVSFDCEKLSKYEDGLALEIMYSKFNEACYEYDRYSDTVFYSVDKETGELTKTNVSHGYLGSSD